MQRLAIYDMDKTITRAPTWAPFLLHAVLQRAPWRLALLPVVGAASMAYALGLLSRGGLKQVAQAAMVGGAVPVADVDRLAASFAERLAVKGIYREARAQMARDRAAGYRLVLATASFRFYVTSLADRLGFEAVIATESRHGDHGAVLARIDGENCYGPVKLAMIEAWMADQGIARADAQILFYSDHVSDVPTLSWADGPVVINPHPPLRALAVQRGWPVRDWTR